MKSKADTAQTGESKDAQKTKPHPLAKSPIVICPDGQIIRKFTVDMLPRKLRQKHEEVPPEKTDR